MAHSSTELLIDYWRQRMRGPDAPTRASINPADFPTLLPQVFILGRMGPGDYAFRLVGGFVGDLHRRDLRGVSFSTLWAQNARIPLQTALESARRRIDVVRMTAEVQAGPNTLEMEIVLMPLANPEGQIDRFLGFYQPKAPVQRLRGLAADRLQILAFNTDGAPAMPEQPRLRLAAIGGQRVG